MGERAPAMGRENSSSDPLINQAAMASPVVGPSGLGCATLAGASLSSWDAMGNRAARHEPGPGPGS